MVFDVAICSFLVIVAAAVASMVMARYTPEEQRVLQISFVMHVLFIIANMAVVKYVYGRGDMYSFYTDALEISAWLGAEPSLWLDLFPWMFSYETDFTYAAGSEGTRVMIGLSTICVFFLFKSFPAMCFAPGLVGYFAKIALFDAFRNAFGPQHRVWVAIAFTCVPSVVFWTAGMIKECIAVICLGLVASGWRGAYARKPLGIAYFVLGLYLLQVIKGHFMLTGVIAAGAMIYWTRSVKDGKVAIRPITFVASAVLTVIGIGIIGEIAPRFAISNLADEMVFLQSKAAGGSAIDIGIREDMGTAEFLVLSPVALITGLYRPFIFESSNPAMLLNSLETTAFLLLTLRGLARRRLRGIPEVAVRYPALVFLVVFSALSALGVGLATGNLGTMSRYRAPVIPFFVLALIVLDSRTLPMGETNRRPAPRPRPHPRGRVTPPRPQRPSKHPGGHTPIEAGRPASGSA